MNDFVPERQDLKPFRDGWCRGCGVFRPRRWSGICHMCACKYCDNLRLDDKHFTCEAHIQTALKQEKRCADCGKRPKESVEIAGLPWKIAEPHAYVVDGKPYCGGCSVHLGFATTEFTDRYRSEKARRMNAAMRKIEARGASRESSKRRREATKAKVDAIKIQSGCVDCGFNSLASALEFDHLPGFVKCGNVSSMYGRSWNAIEVEIAKCEVVCTSCHRIRTAERRKELTTVNAS